MTHKILPTWSETDSFSLRITSRVFVEVTLFVPDIALIYLSLSVVYNPDTESTPDE